MTEETENLFGNVAENSSKKENVTSGKEQANEQELVNYTFDGDEKSQKQDVAKDGKKDSDKDVDGKSKDTFGDRIVGEMKDEIAKSKDTDNPIKRIGISIKVSDIQKVAGKEGDVPVDVKAIKITEYVNGKIVEEEVTVQMSPQEAQAIMDIVNEKNKGLGLDKAPDGKGKSQESGGKDKNGEENEKEQGSVVGEAIEAIKEAAKALKNNAPDKKQLETASQDLAEQKGVEAEQEEQKGRHSKNRNL